jgi:uncharacterized membrane protein required for colicin V production
LTVVDVLVLGTLGIGLILGMVRGFLVQFTGLAGLVGGLLLAERYYPGLRKAALDSWLRTEHNGEIAFVSIVVFSVLVTAIVGWLVGKALDKLQLGAYDRFMGGAFGLLKSGLICAAVLLAVVYFSPDGGNIEKHIGSSKSRRCARFSRREPTASYRDGAGRITGGPPRYTRRGDSSMLQSLPLALSGGWIALIVLVVVAVWFIGLYNGLVRLKNIAKEAWAQIDVQLKRRHDLIPNLVETAKGYMKHERETLEAVIQARNAAVAATDDPKQGPAQVAAAEAPGSGGAHLHREPHRVRAAALQRLGAPLQHEAGADPDQYREELR